MKYTNDNLAICTFTLAIDRYGKGEKKTDWIRITVIGKQAENCEKYLSKGSTVAIEGRIQTGSYEKNGQRVYTTDIYANRVEFLSRSTKVDENPRQSVSEASHVSEDPGVFEPLDDDSLPFN